MYPKMSADQVLKLVVFTKLKALGWGEWEKLFAVPPLKGQFSVTLLPGKALW